MEADSKSTNFLRNYGLAVQKFGADPEPINNGSLFLSTLCIHRPNRIQNVYFKIQKEGSRNKNKVFNKGRDSVAYAYENDIAMMRWRSDTVFDRRSDTLFESTRH